MAFNKEKNLQKIQTAASYFILVLALNAIALIIGLVNIQGSAILAVILIINFLIITLTCAVFIQAFTAIKEHFDYIHTDTNSESGLNAK
tara:strand:- start:1098 stop:1364 length:267 start_codon:yes stop_codon:yes gene_type:complete